LQGTTTNAYPWKLENNHLPSEIQLIISMSHTTITATTAAILFNAKKIITEATKNYKNYRTYEQKR
jgi:hypothetical protein